MLVACVVRLRNILLAQLVCKLSKLLCAVGVECRLDCNGRIGKGQVLALFKHSLHCLCGKRCPCAVLDKRNRPVLIISLGKVVYKLTHKREDICVVGCCGKNKLAVAERILNSLSHIVPCKVHYRHLRSALSLQLLGKLQHSRLCVAVNGSICNKNTVVLCSV